MKAETPEKVRELLSTLGFEDVRAEHQLNDPHMERNFGGRGAIVVWGRDWSDCCLQWAQGYEEVVTICSTEDLEVLERATKELIAYIESLEALSVYFGAARVKLNEEE